VNLENVTRDDWIVGGLALVLVLDLLILPWFSVGGSVSVGGATITIGGSLTATDAPDSLLGVLGVLAALLVVADLAVERLAPQTQIPSIGGSRTTTRLVLAGATALFLALKFLFQLSHFGNLGFGFWFGLVLTVALVYVAIQARAGAPLVPSGMSMPSRPASPPPPPPAPPTKTAGSASRGPSGGSTPPPGS
jgi:hypothetical protein